MNPSTPYLNLDRGMSMSFSSGPSSMDTLDTFVDTELLILLLDVGQGESTIIMERKHDGNRWTPNWTAIIDGGFPLPGRGAIIRYLRALEADTVDLMVCTHFDGDHTRGLTDFLKAHTKQRSAPSLTKTQPLAMEEETKSQDPSSLKKKSSPSMVEEPRTTVKAGKTVKIPENPITVERLLVRNRNSNDAKSETKVHLLDAARAKGVTVEQATSGAVIRNLLMTKMTCLHVNNQGYLQDENTGSIALLIEYGDSFAYYTAGDLPTDEENKLVFQTKPLAFKCGHHGSNGSTSQDFLNHAKPSIALISCGKQSYGHPTYGVIERLLNCDTMRLVFLTNCIHNRRSLNPAYAHTTNEMKPRYEDKIKATYTSNKPGGFPAEYGQDYDKYINSLLSSQPPDDFVRARTACLRAALSASQHHAANVPDRVKAVVAGSKDHLGTIALRVKRQQVTVGCYYVDDKDKGKWCWWNGEDAKPMSGIDDDGLGKILSDAVVRDGVIVEEPDSPRRKDLETSGYQAHLKKRLDGGYSRCTELTIAGLLERQDGTPFVPFCDKCRENDEADLFKVQCPNCTDQTRYFHDDCFKQVWTSLCKEAKKSNKDARENDKEKDQERTAEKGPQRKAGQDPHSIQSIAKPTDRLGDVPPNLEADAEEGIYHVQTSCRCIFCFSEKCLCDECKKDREQIRNNVFETRKNSGMRTRGLDDYLKNGGKDRNDTKG